jgi:undecaprenyl-diphosphatase
VTRPDTAAPEEIAGARDPTHTLLGPLGAGLAVALLAMAFAALAGWALEGDSQALDQRVLEAARSLREAHPRLGEVMRDLSGLGSTVVLTIAVTITVLYLVLVRRPTTALLVAVSASGGAVMVSVLKAAFGRARPGIEFADLVVAGLSFPSGHASMSAAVFLTLGALVANTRGRWRERLYVLAAAALLAVLVGLSRIALGVHWTTDVLAGWAFGSAWAIGWVLLERRLVRAR